MDPLTLFVAGLLGFGTPALPPSPPARAVPAAVGQWRPLIAEAAHRFGLPERWIVAVMRAESDGQAYIHGRPNISPAGAIGLMQVMPGTYRELRQRQNLGPDPADPHDNILAGVAYLRELYDRFGTPGFLAAYNAGPTRYQQFLVHRRPLPAETRRYLAQLAPQVDGPERPVSPGLPRPAEPPLLRELRDADRGAVSRPDEATEAGLFVLRRSPLPLSVPASAGGLFVHRATTPDRR